MKKTLFKSKANRNEHIFCFCMLIFFVLHWFVFWAYANFNSIRMAFTEYNDVTFTHDLLPSGRTFENFKKFFTEIFQRARREISFKRRVLSPDQHVVLPAAQLHGGVYHL